MIGFLTDQRAGASQAMKSYVPPPKDQEEATEAATKKRKITKEKEEKEAAKAAKAEAKAEAKAAAKKAKTEAKTEAKKAQAKAKVKKDSKESKAASSMGNPQNVKLEAGIKAKAEKLNLTEALLKLAAWPDVIATGKSHAQMLKALEENRGFVHPAKRALLGAWANSCSCLSFHRSDL